MLAFVHLRHLLACNNDFVHLQLSFAVEGFLWHGITVRQFEVIAAYPGFERGSLS